MNIPYTDIDLSDEAAKISGILQQPRYAAVLLFITLAAYAAYALLLNYSLILATLSAGNLQLLFTLLPTLVLGYSSSTSVISITFSVLISLAIGVNVALVTYRLVELSSFGREDASSFGGMALAVVAPACPACATALFAVSGLSTVLALLPFNGTELKVLSLFLLAGSAVWVTSQIHNSECEFC